MRRHVPVKTCIFLPPLLNPDLAKPKKCCCLADGSTWCMTPTRPLSFLLIKSPYLFAVFVPSSATAPDAGGVSVGDDGHDAHMSLR